MWTTFTPACPLQRECPAMQAQCGPDGCGGTGWGMVWPSCLWCTWQCLLHSRPLQPCCVMCSNPLPVWCCRSYADFESHQWRECLASPSLPYVLQILTGLCQNHHTTQVSRPTPKEEPTVALCLTHLHLPLTSLPITSFHSYTVSPSPPPPSFPLTAPPG